ncbi:FAD-dependent oxidoreductase [Iamia sp. SCSIO 61187]|uniref:FAD-dependent oxidoreductase n=1 Tax=Iamia sp. SCSIO 61187 TaxID=2722752 RepID=UPI001C630569|nr:FAD-dependent oxidoreductase [Iamia sp. SCSIO 61187]QYG91675.1 FAD-dependent oxidoreductase [Iamia sp. SCSIO 61187]
MPERLVVIGGDAAGMAAASQARRLNPNLDIVDLERGTRTSYSACGIPYLVAGDVASPDDLVARTPEEFRREHRIDVRMRHEAMAVDLDARTVEVRSLDHDRTFRLGFDQLMFGTGARPIRPALPGIDGAQVRGVQTLDDGCHLLTQAKEMGCRDVVVVGAGYIGLEMAEAFHRWGARVVLVEAAERPMSRTLDPDMADRVVGQIHRLGIEARFGVGVEGFEAGVVHTAAGPVRADLVVLGLGVAPESTLAEQAGLTLGTRGSISVDRRQAASAPGVWSAGDCAETYNRVSQRRMHVALGTVANKTGRVAGVNIGGGYATFPGVVGTAITKVCGTEVSRTGLSTDEAERAGFQVVSATVETTTVAGYLPNAEPMTAKAIAEKGTGRLLGFQIVGGAGAAKRIDTAATAITAEMTVMDVVELDLAYAPPFSSVWDPVQVAARAVVRQV